MANGFKRNFRGMSNVQKLMDEGVIEDTAAEDGMEVVTKVQPLVFNCAACNIRIGDNGDSLCGGCRAKVDLVRIAREKEEAAQIQKIAESEAPPPRIRRVVPVPPNVLPVTAPAVTPQVMAEVVEEVKQEAEEPYVHMCPDDNCGFARIIVNPSEGMLAVVCAECGNLIVETALDSES